MNRKEILIVGSNAEKVLAALNNKEKNRNAISETDEEKAIEKFHQQHFDAVIFLNTPEVANTIKLGKIFTIQNPDLIILQESENVNWLQAIEMEFEKLEKRNKPIISFQDDVLKHAGININFQ